MPAARKRSKKKTGATRNTKHKSSGLSWMVMGLLVGLFVVFLMYLDKIPGQRAQQDSAQKNTATAKQKQSEAKAQKSSRSKDHQFEFYTILPEREVEFIEAEKEPAQKPTPTAQQDIDQLISPVQRKPAEPASMTLYQLQVGAFKELQKADAMKARLALLGVESNIQVFSNKGQKMYRVRVGPSTDSQRINQIKAQLKAQNINTFMQRL